MFLKNKNIFKLMCVFSKSVNGYNWLLSGHIDTFRVPQPEHIDTFGGLQSGHIHIFRGAQSG